MSARNIGIVYKKELTEALRDRRTLIVMFIVPLVLFPLVSVGFGAAIAALIGKAKEERATGLFGRSDIVSLDFEWFQDGNR